MSGTVTPAVPETPAVQATPIAATPAATLPVAGAAIEPAAGTQPPGGDAPATPPAALSSPEVPPSLLSGATPAEPPPAEAAADPVAQPAEPLPLPSFEPFVLPEGVSLDAERQTQFTTALAEAENRVTQNPAELHKVMQEMGQKMLDLYLEEGKTLETTLRSQLEPAIRDETTQANTQVWLNMRKQWTDEVRADPELGGSRMNETLERVGKVMDRYGSDMGADRLGSLREAFTMTGAGDHPEIMRAFNWLAGFINENTRMLAAPPAQQQSPMRRSDRLYRNSIPFNGAA